MSIRQPLLPSPEIDFGNHGEYILNQREGRIQSAERAVPTSNSAKQYESSFSLTSADSRQR